MSAPTISAANATRLQHTRRTREQFAKGVVEFACMWLNGQQEGAWSTEAGGLFTMDLASLPGATNLTQQDCDSIERTVMRLLEERTPFVYGVTPTLVNLRNIDSLCVALDILFIR
jgi:hypothetical protein